MARQGQEVPGVDVRTESPRGESTSSIFICKEGKKEECQEQLAASGPFGFGERATALALGGAPHALLIEVYSPT